jgi:site-specific DNA-methyltransferase (adenine-specific)
MNDIFNENVPLKTETPAFAKHVLPAVPLSEVYLEDCVTALKRYADNHFDLAIVDPPYGIGAGKGVGVTRGRENQYTVKDWDTSIPTKEYWEQLFRVSKNQIVWGGNYMTEFLRPSRGWIYWQKMMGGNYADGELAWTSFDRNLKEFTKRSDQGNRFHPTQKPIKLYEWILHHYAEEGDLILDTHLGSGSSRIAAYKGGFNFVGFEIDQEYYEKQEKRFNDFKSQLRLF